MDDLITDGRYSWVRLDLTPFVATVINAGMWAIIVIMPTIKAEYGGTRAMVSPPTTAIRFATSSIVWCLQRPQVMLSWCCGMVESLVIDAALKHSSAVRTVGRPAMLRDMFSSCNLQTRLFP